MASTNINGTVTVQLSPTDRELLRSIARALGVEPEEERSFADTTRRLVESEEDTVRRLLNGDLCAHDLAEGDWLLETERRDGDELDG